MAVTLAKDSESIFALALEEARLRRHEYVTLEHVLNSMTRHRAASAMLKGCGADGKKLRRDLEEFFDENVEQLPEDPVREPEHTAAFGRVLQRAAGHVQSSGRKEIEPGDVLASLLQEPGSHAAYLLKKQGVARLDVLRYISHGITKGEEEGAASTAPAGDGEEEFGQEGSPLERFTVNLNERAAKGQIDPLIGRAQELARTLQVLCRRRRNNPVYVGEPGVGKTALVEGLALAIHEKRVPKLLEKAVIYSLEMGSLLAGTKFRGQFEERLKGVVDAVKQQPDAILFIDEIHTLVGAGATTGGSMDASNLLKPALSSGEIRVIGSTTFKDYKASFDRDRALERRFQRIDVLEPTLEETVQILTGLRSRYEAHHGVTFSDSALRAAAELSAKYVNDRQLPDKAIDVIDEAGAADRLLPEGERKKEIGPREVEAVVSRIAKVPAKSVSASDEEALSRLEPELKKMIFGQDRAIESLASAIKLSRSGLASPDKPIGSFLFSGPTGVGKTELSKQLARILGVEFLRYDMSEYMEKHTVSRLIGAPPGYVGFDQGGLLTDAIRKTPHAVLVLDEIEKAHPDLFNILLQVMDHATLTDNVGRKADFRHVAIILTTNAGAREMAAGSVGFGTGGSPSTAGGNAKQAIEKTFSPEFRNRLDAWITFDTLTPEVILLVVDKLVGELAAQLREKKITLELSPGARQWLADKGFDKVFGARPMARLIQNEVKKPLAEAILFGALKGGGTAFVDVAGDKLTVRGEEGAPALAPGDGRAGG
jgi:ATP-dependent Clp protease ATP-binding subunit ClpA